MGAGPITAAEGRTLMVAMRSRKLTLVVTLAVALLCAPGTLWAAPAPADDAGWLQPLQERLVTWLSGLFADRGEAEPGSVWQRSGLSADPNGEPSTSSENGELRLSTAPVPDPSGPGAGAAPRR